MKKPVTGHQSNLRSVDGWDVRDVMMGIRQKAMNSAKTFPISRYFCSKRIIINKRRSIIYIYIYI